MAGQQILGVLPFCAELARADLEGRSADVDAPDFTAAVGRIAQALQEEFDGRQGAKG